MGARRRRRPAELKNAPANCDREHASSDARVAADLPLTRPEACRALTSWKFSIAPHASHYKDGCRSTLSGSRPGVAMSCAVPLALAIAVGPRGRKTSACPRELMGGIPRKAYSKSGLSARDVRCIPKIIAHAASPTERSDEGKAVPPAPRTAGCRSMRF